MSELEARPAGEFLEALRKRNLEGKRALIADLRRRKTDKAVSILIDVLRDDSWYLRELAVEALGEAGEEAVPELMKLLGSGLWYTRAAVARTLGKIAHSPSIPALVELLDDSNQTVQGASFASLADFSRKGHARPVARAIWDRGARRAGELKRLFVAVQPEAAAPVVALLNDPATLLGKDPSGEPSTPEETS